MTSTSLRATARAAAWAASSVAKVPSQMRVILSTSPALSGTMLNVATYRTPSNDARDTIAWFL
jgi:hypothetical protein